MAKKKTNKKVRKLSKPKIYIRKPSKKGKETKVKKIKAYIRREKLKESRKSFLARFFRKVFRKK